MDKIGDCQYEDTIYMIYQIQHFPSYRKAVVKIYLLLVVKINKTGCTDHYRCCYH